MFILSKIFYKIKRLFCW